eukprot:5568992-Prymnesium_polylepis.2
MPPASTYAESSAAGDETHRRSEMDDACCVALALCKTIRQEKTSEEMHSVVSKPVRQRRAKSCVPDEGGAALRQLSCTVLRAGENQRDVDPVRPWWSKYYQRAKTEPVRTRQTLDNGLPKSTKQYGMPSATGLADGRETPRGVCA